MNNPGQHKMYNFEVTPPAGIWEKIAGELDDSALSNKFPSTLFNMEVVPPTSAWEKITKNLDESLFIDEYSKKLKDAEVNPPAGVWERIKIILENQNESGKRRIIPILRYAATAAIISLIAWGGFQLSNSKTKNPELAKQEVVQPKLDTIKSETNQNANPYEKAIASTDITPSDDDARNDAALEASKKTYAKLDIPVSSKIKNAADFYFNTSSAPVINSGQLPIDPSETDISESGNRYIMLITPEGNIIRMSKKLGDLVCCVSGQQEDFECVNKIKKWREQIASSAKGHSPGNFMDILSLVNSLQEKN